MLYEKHIQLKKEILDSTVGLTKTYECLEVLLSRPDKEYCVVVDGKEYVLRPAFTLEDKIALDGQRKELILLLMSDCFGVFLENMSLKDEDLEKVFSPLLCFTRGVDPKDMQLEKIEIENLYDVVDENGNKVTALPLNFESSYVQADLKGDHVQVESQETNR